MRRVIFIDTELSNACCLS